MELLFHWNKEALKKLFVMFLKCKTGGYVGSLQIRCQLETL